MANYSAQTEFKFGHEQLERQIVVNGTSVTIDSWDGTGWVLSDTISNGTAILFTANVTLRVTPNGGASFFIDESDRI